MFTSSDDFQKSNSCEYFMVLNLETHELFLTPRISAHTALLPGPCFNTGLGFLVDTDMISTTDVHPKRTNQYKSSNHIESNSLRQQDRRLKRNNLKSQKLFFRFFQHLPTPDVSSFWIPSTHNSTSCAGCAFGMASDSAKSSRRAACRTATLLASPAMTFSHQN